MRGAGDQLSVGERIAFYRRRRGLTRGTLAALLGRSEDWLSKIERGERQLQKIELAVEMARHLRVTSSAAWPSARTTERPSTQRTCADRSARSARRPAWTPANGRRARCVTPSSP
ncbi:helix-turn-helix domain-containing protein [Nocardioides rotundus]|nr:helix-turn-helix domain-containing protein [Nocardioides rotundus]